MPHESKILAEIPTSIDPGQDWLVDYWARYLGVSSAEVTHIVKKVGPEIKDIERYLDAGVTIAIRDDSGQLRRVTKVISLKNGVAISVPYHSAKEGWLFDHPNMYDRTEGITPVTEMTHFTVSDRVKLSIHFGGLVHFSRGGKQDIISGYDDAQKKAKGLGLVSPEPINVTSGPLFGVLLRGLEEFELLGERHAEIFDPDDLWYHPRYTAAKANAYLLEGFMLPTSRLPSVNNSNGKRVLTSELPFMGLITFPFHLRVIELPHLDFFIGLILHKLESGEPSGYCLSGPGCGPPGEMKRGITAWYPRPEFVPEQPDVKSLDKPPSKGRRK